MIDKVVPENLVTILMVEDDELDVEVFKRTLKKEHILNPFYNVTDGEEALSVLRGQHPDIQISKPYLLVMDINMPRMNGIECLSEIRQDPELKDTVVFFMTTSEDEQDMYEAYNLNVAGYMVKSNLGENFLKSVRMLDQYFHAIVLPDA
ncbi:response regulator [Agaribacter flavus]|uniref:Response regulator n=1 Tax=Agaribacter flavus TaxID=1902781 RepID=A0ABV7FRD7_9ALTE